MKTFQLSEKLLKKIADLIQAKKNSPLKKLVKDIHFADMAEIIDELNLDEPGVNRLIKSAYSLFELQTYFTAGVKEVKAWTIKKGMTAPQAAGVIHTDFEKGFIRAEVMKYNDFIEFGSEVAVKDAGKFWDDVAASSPRSGKVVEAFKLYAETMEKAGYPYR